MKLTSSAFSANAAIPPKYTCDGDDLSPPLRWTDVPSSAKSLALIVTDPDAPDPENPKTTWVHWVLYNLPATEGSLPEGTTASDLPVGTEEGRNDWNRTGYGGPCPPVGRHRYIHTLYALDTLLPDLETPTRTEVETEMRGHILTKAELVGMYERNA